MKKFQQVVEQTFQAVQTVKGVDLSDFSVYSLSLKPLTVTVWLHHEKELQIDHLIVELKEGTTWELSAKVAKWLHQIDFEGIRRSFELWEELAQDV